MEEGSDKNVEHLGELETAVMGVLWSLSEADVHEALDYLVWDKPLAYTTVMTVLNRLVAKGYAQREKHGRMFRYRPLLAREQAARSALSRVVDRFFDGLRGKAMAELLSADEALSEDELAALEVMIRRQREDRGR